VVLYYSSAQYSRVPFKGDFRIRGSSVCLDIETVNATRTLDTGETTHVSANLCHCMFGLDQGISDSACAVAIFFAVLYRTRRSKAYDQEIDDAFQTAQDYSILVEDPPPDATDPDEWHQYFLQFGPVALVTVALDNGDLVRALADHANTKRQMENEVGGQQVKLERSRVLVLFDGLPHRVRYYLQSAGFGRDIHYWLLQLSILDAEILYFQTKPFFAMVRSLSCTITNCNTWCRACTCCQGNALARH